jgi:hypothetical protein
MEINVKARYYALGCLLLYSSRISLAAKNCLTAHARTNSGAIIIQNITFSRFQRAFHRLGGGTFGCTAVHAQMITVDTQLQIIPNNVRRITDFESSVVPVAIGLLVRIGTASTLP